MTQPRHRPRNSSASGAAEPAAVHQHRPDGQRLSSQAGARRVGCAVREAVRAITVRVRAMFTLISRISLCRTVLCGLPLLVALSIVSCVPAPPPTAMEQPRSAAVEPSDARRETRQRFLEMFARTYFPGRTGQLVIVPREGDFITRPDPDVRLSCMARPGRTTPPFHSCSWVQQ